MAVLKELQTQVRTAIKPWTSSEHEPPFTPPDLITMALIINNRAMKEGEILHWIEKTFKYYRNTVANIPRYWFDDDEEDGESRTFKDLPAAYVMWQAFGSYDVPAIATSGKEWTVCINEARIYLQQRFGPRWKTRVQRRGKGQRLRLRRGNSEEGRRSVA